MVPALGTVEVSIIILLSKYRTNSSDHAKVWTTTSSKALKMFDYTVFNVTLCALLRDDRLACPSVKLSKGTTTERHLREIIPELRWGLALCWRGPLLAFDRRLWLRFWLFC